MADTAAPRVARDLIPRLPRTFAPSVNDQLRQWDLLFPAERRVIEGQLNWLAALPPAEFKSLFAPITALEAKMDLPHWDAKSSGLTIESTGILARSPLYPQWRSEVEKIFARIDSALAGSVRPSQRLVACVLPPGLPLEGASLWPGLEKSGRWVQLDRALGVTLPALTAAVAARKLPDNVEAIESTWILESDKRFTGLVASSPATVLSWSALDPLRREFLTRLNTIRRTLTSVDQTHDDLRKLDPVPLVDKTVAADRRVLEFVRSLLLSGNGSLIFGNSFVQWGSAEALRRAQPRALFACFGIRAKLKPFSSAVLFEDQSRSNPVPDEEDPAGSLVDGMMLADYVRLAAARVPAYESNTLILLGAWDLDRVLVLSSKPVPGKLTGAELTSLSVTWLG